LQDKESGKANKTLVDLKEIDVMPICKTFRVDLSKPLFLFERAYVLGTRNLVLTRPRQQLRLQNLRQGGRAAARHMATIQELEVTPGTM
jgi:hypothetical protein